MKRLMILVTTLLSITVQAQNTGPAQKILIGFSFSPDYCFRTLKSNDGSSSAGLVIKTRNDIEIAKFGFTTGLNIIFNLTKKTALETGVQYSNKGYQTKNLDLIYFPPDPASPSKFKTNYAYTYIGIPVKAKFTMGKGNIHFISGIGFIANFLLNGKQTNIYKYPDGKTEKKTQSITSGFNKADIIPVISIGVDYKVTNKVHLLAEPTFRYGLIKTKDAPVIEKLWNIGVNFGIYYGLSGKRNSCPKAN